MPIKSPPLTVWGDGRDPSRPVPLPGCSTLGDSVGSRLWVWKRECQGIPSPCFPSSVYCFLCLNIIILECKGDLCDSGASLHSLSSLSLRQPQFMCCSRCTGRLCVDTVKHLPAAGCPAVRGFGPLCAVINLQPHRLQRTTALKAARELSVLPSSVTVNS